jgi:hypothetical protein
VERGRDPSSLLAGDAPSPSSERSQDEGPRARQCGERRDRDGASRRAGRHEPGVLRVQRALARRRATDPDVPALRRRTVPRAAGVRRRGRRAVVVVRRRRWQRWRGRRRVNHRAGAVRADARRAPAALLHLGRRGRHRDDRQREERRH